MSIIQGTSMASAAGGFDVPNAIHLSAASSQYFTRTPAVSSNQTTFTVNTWVRLGKLPTPSRFILSTGGTLGSMLWVDFTTANSVIELMHAYSGGKLVTSQVFRDPATYGMLTIAFDTTQATAANRLKMYWNGVQITAFSTASYPSLNATTNWNSTVAHEIGRYNYGGDSHFDGNMSEIVHIDGQQLDPTSFGEFDDNGVWRPIDVSGLTFGTNGFYLTSADGVDQSGNSNNFTPTNSPTDTSDTPTTTYPTWNPLALMTSSANKATLSNGALKASASGTDYNGVIGTQFPTSGKWGFQVTVNAKVSSAAPAIGIAQLSYTPFSATVATAYTQFKAFTYAADGTKRNDAGTSSAYGATFTTSDVIECLFDIDAQTIIMKKGGVSQGTMFSTLTVGAPYAPFVFLASAGDIVTIDCGQSGYTPSDSSYKAINSANIYANDPPAIEDGSAHFQTALHTGTGSAITINQTGNSTFTPDFVWTKGRSGATDHILSNILSGTGKYLVSNTTAAEVTNAQALTAFGAGSISYGTLAAANTNAATYVSWMWKGGGSGVSNTDGSITSTVSANTTAGFSIVTYTGNGTAGANIGHGLPVAPKFIIVKERGPDGNLGTVYHGSLGATKGVYLGGTHAAQTDSTFWNDTTPDASVFTLGSDTDVNGSGQTYVAICWTDVEGFSKFSAYVANGVADGPFVSLPFKPAMILLKDISTAADWEIIDAARSAYNPVDLQLFPNKSAAESSAYGVLLDILSNGFKLRQNVGDPNNSTHTYIYAAFAEVPSYGATPAKAR